MADIVEDFFPSRFIRAADLKGKEIDVTIDRVEAEDLENDGKKVTKPIVHFKNAGIKPLVCNKTNGLTIAAALGEVDYKKWAGRQIRLYADLVSFKGKVTEAVRVKRIPPPLKEDLNDEVPI
jgi:hypothetical protein